MSNKPVDPNSAKAKAAFKSFINYTKAPKIRLITSRNWIFSWRPASLLADCNVIIEPCFIKLVLIAYNCCAFI